MATNNALNNTASALTVSNGFTVSSGAVSISTGTSSINIGTDAAAKTITIGNNISATTLSMKTGSAGYTLASATGTIISITNFGNISYPFQPAFYYYLNTNDASVTGNGAVYQLGTTGNALTKQFDQSSNCSTLGVFTAPVTGVYNFVATIKFTTMTVLMTSGILSIVATAATSTYEINTGNAQTAANTYSFNCPFFISMTAGDTCYVTAQISNGVSNAATATAGTKGSTFFSGYLVA